MCTHQSGCDSGTATLTTASPTNRELFSKPGAFAAVQSRRKHCRCMILALGFLHLFLKTSPLLPFVVIADDRGHSDSYRCHRGRRDRRCGITATTAATTATTTVRDHSGGGQGLFSGGSWLLWRVVLKGGNGSGTRTGVLQVQQQ